MDIDMLGPWVTDVEMEYVQDAMMNWYKNAYYYCETFEREFAAYHDRKYGLMTPNCTSAIHLLLTGLGIKDDDEVLVPECTWIATAAPVSYLRAKSVFCDIDPSNWCLDPRSVEEKITLRTKAIIAVGLYGNMPDMDGLTSIADRHRIPIVEDAAEALGSTYKGIKAGKFGIGSVFSFHRTKTLTTGEGGMLLIDSDELYNRCKFLRDHGRAQHITWYFTEVAYKYMPSNVQAALGYGQFKRLSELIARKRDIFHMYQDRLREIGDIQLNPEPEGVFNSYWATTVVFGKSHRLTKEDAMKRLAELGIPSRPFFYPLSSLPAFPAYDEKSRPSNPHAYDVSSRGINLPSAMNLTIGQIDRVCEGVKRVLAR